MLAHQVFSRRHLELFCLAQIGRAHVCSSDLAPTPRPVATSPLTPDRPAARVAESHARASSLQSPSPRALLPRPDRKSTRLLFRSGTDAASCRNFTTDS